MLLFYSILGLQMLLFFFFCLDAPILFYPRSKSMISWLYSLQSNYHQVYRVQMLLFYSILGLQMLLFQLFYVYRCSYNIPSLAYRCYYSILGLQMPLFYLFLVYRCSYSIIFQVYRCSYNIPFSAYRCSYSILSQVYRCSYSILSQVYRCSYPDRQYTGCSTDWCSAILAPSPTGRE